jgi:hypothetical protein
MNHHDPDRLKSIIIPVLKESIESMLAAGFDVDLYLIVSYVLTPDREKLIRRALPKSVNLEVWNDATPIDYDDGYRNRPPPTRVQEVNRALARQHRYVVRDKLNEYDIFAAFEDDMLIKGEHIKQHLNISKWLQDFHKHAPHFLPPKHHGIRSDSVWFGNLSKIQLQRIRPGFIRVEALINEQQFPTQRTADIENVPANYNFSDLGYFNSTQMIDPSVCCHVSGHVGRNGTSAPLRPNATQLMVWETGISGLSVREMPDGTWIGLLPGPRYLPDDEINPIVGRYYPYYSRVLKNKPHVSSPKFLAQSAGWIMTRNQLLEMHIDLCQGSFLPPFNTPTFEKDGLSLMNVEYWSGGLQMWCPHRGCNIQRIFQLDPLNFSKHLMYHTTNNKQRQIPRNRRVRVLDLIGQLNTIRIDAKRAKENILKKRKKRNNK